MYNSFVEHLQFHKAALETQISERSYMACIAIIWTKYRSAPEPTVQQAIETLVIWDAIVLIMTSL